MSLRKLGKNAGISLEQKLCMAYFGGKHSSVFDFLMFIQQLNYFYLVEITI